MLSGASARSRSTLNLPYSDFPHADAMHRRRSTCPHNPPQSPEPIRPIQLPRRRRLRPCPLAPNRHPHRVPPPPVRPHIPQPFNILPQLPPQIVLDLHA